MPRPRVVLSLLFVLLMAVRALQPAVLHLGSSHRLAQGAPKPNWLPADKQGFGTSRTRASRVWFTLQGGELSEVYYPRLDTPSFRDLQFAVDGVPERDGAFHRSLMLDGKSLTYGQISTAAGLEPRAVHPAGLVDRRRAPHGATVGGGLPLRDQVRLSYRTGR